MRMYTVLTEFGLPITGELAESKGMYKGKFFTNTVGSCIQEIHKNVVMTKSQLKQLEEYGIARGKTEDGLKLIVINTCFAREVIYGRATPQPLEDFQINKHRLKVYGQVRGMLMGINAGVAADFLEGLSTYSDHSARIMSNKIFLQTLNINKSFIRLCNSTISEHVRQFQAGLEYMQNIHCYMVSGLISYASEIRNMGLNYQIRCIGNDTFMYIGRYRFNIVNNFTVEAYKGKQKLVGCLFSDFIEYINHLSLRDLKWVPSINA